MNPRVILSAALLALTFGQLPELAAEQWVVTDRGEWEALVGGIYGEEDFEDQILTPGLTIDSDFGSILSGRWRDRIQVGEEMLETRFFFDQPTKAFGANFFMALGGSGIHLLLDDNELVVPRVPESFNGEFFGFVSETPFQSVSFLSRLPGQAAGLETYSMDNLVHSANFNGTVTHPEPVKMQTATHTTQSTLTIDVFLGHPDEGGELLKSTGPNALTGTVNLAVDLDNEGNGYVQILAADLDFQDFGPSTIDVGTLGTIDASLQDIHLLLESVRLEVTNFQFAATNTMPVTIEINDGVAAVFNPTGVIASLLPDGYSLDFFTEPLVEAADGDEAVMAGTVTPGELNAVVYPFLYPLFSLTPDVQVYARFSADLHVAVPEASSLLLTGMAGTGAIVVARRRRMESK